jgi:hypothetical protein
MAATIRGVAIALIASNDVSEDANTRDLLQGYQEIWQPFCLHKSCITPFYPTFIAINAVQAKSKHIKTITSNKNNQHV